MDPGSDPARRDGRLAELVAGTSLVTLFAALVLVLLDTVPEILFWLSVLGFVAVVASELRAGRP